LADCLERDLVRSADRMCKNNSRRELRQCGSKTTYRRQARGTLPDDECAIGAGFGRGNTMGIPLEIAPLLDVVLTLSAMLGLFAYVYWLAGKEKPRDAGLIGPVSVGSRLTRIARLHQLRNDPRFAVTSAVWLTVSRLCHLASIIPAQTDAHSNESPPLSVSVSGKRDFAGQRQRRRKAPSHSTDRQQRQRPC
jgi:hypothetical protein